MARADRLFALGAAGGLHTSKGREGGPVRRDEDDGRVDGEEGGEEWEEGGREGEDEDAADGLARGEGGEHAAQRAPVVASGGGDHLERRRHGVHSSDCNQSSSEHIRKEATSPLGTNPSFYGWSDHPIE